MINYQLAIGYLGNSAALASDDHLFHKFKIAVTKRNASKKIRFLPVVCCESPLDRVISEDNAMFDYD